MKGHTVGVWVVQISDGNRKITSAKRRGDLAQKGAAEKLIRGHARRGGISV